MDESLLHDEVDRLYAAPRDAFIDERDRRAKALREDGKRDEAAALEKRRKPTVPAWAVDQLPRRHPEQVDALIGAAADLREAQRGAGGDGQPGLRDAADDFRDRVAALRHRAEVVIAEAGSAPPTHIDDVERTLTAAAADPEHHDTLRRGIFERPLPASGFGAAGGLGVATSSASQSDPEAAAAEREERRRRRERRQRLERDRRNLESSRERQQRSAERAEEKADRLRERADQAAREASDEARTLERIDAELADVVDELDRLSQVD
jgi:hypothetical protein